MDGFKRQNGQQFNSRPNNNRQVPPLGAVPRPAPRAIDPNQPMGQKDNISLNSDHDAASQKVSKKKRCLRRWMIILIAVMVFLTAVFAVLFKWYEMQLKPVSSDSNKVSVTVEDGSSVSVVANTLASKNLIRNRLAFEVYVRLNNKNSIKAGTCMIAPSESVADIVNRMNNGCHDFKTITFYPGGTLESSKYKASQSSDGVDKTSVRYILRQAGYSDNEISNAFKAKYDSPLFADRPSGSSLEGYVFGETYQFTGDATAKDVLQTVFDHMYKVVQKNDLVNKFKAQGLTLYQGLTMASIVERELGCEDKPTVERKNRCYQYQRGIAQVFITRYKKKMQLGSDVTFIYAADKAGVKPKVDIDSPYNTRKHTGLPPTPIATPGELSLKAVADPAPGDNLFFIAGDDGLIYFAKTDEEHKNNIDKYCQKLCSIV
ncbi:MAG: endolytic transglycosylase MltG [Candidatus Saccharimonas sp.]